MADPTDAYPTEATNAGRGRDDGDGEAALREVLDEHGEDLAAALERSDGARNLLETAVLVLASADEEEVEYLTRTTANAVHAVDGLATEGTAELADDVGENATEVAAVLETVLDLQREGHLQDLVTLSTAFSASLSSAEVDELAALLEADGGEVVAALDAVLELQREDRLEDLVALAETLSTLEVDEDAARGLNVALGAVGDAERENEPVGILGLLRGLRSPDARAGMGYLLALIRAQGRRVRRR